ncbi:hypothetical protein [Ralstonia sp.]|uniref:hypothetical protein n=1 Tax=Ralstonia sp. TaxID=54061 RepID=UPI00257E5EF3|nr:hypothetical protein [Ralstonia sp.]MBA4282018.1 hypothetical protein [Ralstonia sp.]
MTRHSPLAVRAQTAAAMLDGSFHSTFRQDVAALKSRAAFFISQRRKDVDLYQVLADCLAICERAELSGEVEALRGEHLAAERARGKRAYFEQGADVFLIVGRAVFEPEVNRAASWRYTATLREAAKRQIRSVELVEWLREQGGINALFKARPVEARTARTKTLHLNAQVEVPKDGPFTLTLRRDARGFFDVLEAANG